MYSQASIVGWRTKKVLFTGVRNKHCFSCVFAARKGVEPGCLARGNCAKNYTGHSTGMETSIVNEGFHCSEAMHGVRYYQLVGKSCTYSFLCGRFISRLEVTKARGRGSYLFLKGMGAIRWVQATTADVSNRYLKPKQS